MTVGWVVTEVGSAFNEDWKRLLALLRDPTAALIVVEHRGRFARFGLSGGAVPLPLTVMQILAIDLGTETLPALALGREPAEPGLMERSPRRRSERVIDRHMLARAWGYLGLLSAALVLAGFFVVLLRAGWTPGAPVDRGSPYATPTSRPPP